MFIINEQRPNMAKAFVIFFALINYCILFKCSEGTIYEAFGKALVSQLKASSGSERSTTYQGGSERSWDRDDDQYRDSTQQRQKSSSSDNAYGRRGDSRSSSSSRDSDHHQSWE